uniref:Elongation of very long chain fatty acids protein n=4 Tax=Cacopsylla melanoneura TaxID=428564 RepID=A0A8D8SG94_9HEMI
MSQVIGGVVNITNYLITTDFADPRTKDWFWSGSLWPPFALMFFYHYFVRSLGPRFMKDRKPYNIDNVLKVYNLFQVTFSVFLVYRVIKDCYMNANYSLICQPINKSNTPQAMAEIECIWLYYMAKIIDLLDTVFFVLRKKFKQASFLHVYHHTGMILAGLIGTRYVTGGHSVSLGAVNSTVHVIMYTYYLLSSFDKKFTEAKWKKYITQLQMLQFISLIVHFSFPFIFPCGFPLWPCVVIVPQYMFMLALFYDFYRKAYNKPKQS